MDNEVAKLFNEGITAYKLQDFQSAVAKFQQVLSKQSDVFEAHINLGNAYLKQKKFDDAISAFHKSLELNPGAVNAYINLGNSYFQKKLFKDAILNWKLAFRIDKTKVNTLLNIGIAYNRLGDLYNSFQYYELYFMKTPALGVQELQLKASMSRAKENSLIVVKQALELDARGKLQDTLKFLQAAVKQYPLLAKTYEALGNLYYKRGEYGEAGEHYERALELNSLNSVLHCNLGVIYDKRKLYIDAYYHYKKYVHSFAVTQADQNKIHERLIVLAGKIKSDATVLTLFDEKINSFIRDKNYETAINSLNRLLYTELYPEQKIRFEKRVQELEDLLNPVERIKQQFLEKGNNLFIKQDYGKALVAYNNYVQIVGMDKVDARLKKNIEQCGLELAKASQ